MDFDHQTDPMVAPVIAASRRERPQGRRTPFFALAAVAALVALAIGIFALHPQGGAPGVSVHPTAVPAVNPPALIYTAASLLTPDDIWAVGYGAVGNSSAIVHFDGHHWQTTADALYPNTNLYAISMDSATDGWAAGSSFPPLSGPLLTHYTGGHWVQTTLPTPDVGLTDIQMLSAQDGWALGSDTNNHSIFFHYNGATWTEIPFAPAATSSVVATTMSAFAPQAASAPDSIVPGSGNPDVPHIVQMHMLSDDDGWAVGSYHGVNVVWRYHAGHWTTVHQFSSSGAILGLGVNAANDVWVIGITGPLGGAAASAAFSSHSPLSFGPPVLQHFDGRTWTTVASDVSANAPFLDGATWLASYGTAANTQVVTGLWRNAGGRWTATTFPQPVTGVLSATTQPDGSTLTLAATGGASGPQTPQLLRYANGAWSIVQ